MSKLEEKYTVEELREALKNRMELDQNKQTKDGESARQEALSFLIGKAFLLERHPNPRCLDFYQVDVNYTPTIKDDKWVTVKIISSIRLMVDNIKEEIRISDEIKSANVLDYCVYDDFEPTHRDREYKYKSFHPDNVLGRMEVISTDDYLELLSDFGRKQAIILEQFKKFEA